MQDIMALRPHSWRLTSNLIKLNKFPKYSQKPCRSISQLQPEKEPKDKYDNTDFAIGLVTLCTAAGLGYVVIKKAFKSTPAVEPLLDSSAKKVKVNKDAPPITSNSFMYDVPERQPPQPHPKFGLKPGRPLPEKVPYLLIGAGTATFAALRAIRSREPNAKVLILGDEHVTPYMRPPLSKEFWFEDPEHAVDSRTFKQWNGKKRSAFFEPDEFYVPYEDLMDRRNGGVSIVTGVKVTKVDSENKKVMLEDGTQVHYSKCLLAPGGKPKTLPVLEKAAKQDPEVRKRTMVFRNLDDFEYLVNVMKKVRSVAIVGGGFLGSELACALGRVGENIGVNVSQIFKEEGNLRGVLPGYLSDWSTQKVEECGVCVVPDTEIVNATPAKDDKGLLLKLSDGSDLAVDFVVTCVGLHPNVDMGKASHLEIDDQFGGYIVNSEFLARTNLWVAGDASCFYDPLLGRRRVEHHDHAVVSGRLAGENMTGASKHYKHQSMIWSDLGPEIGFEAVGLVDSRLPTVGIFAKEKEPGVLKAKLNTNLRSEDEEGVHASKPGKVKSKGHSGPSLGIHSKQLQLRPAFDDTATAAALSATSDSSHKKSPEYKKGVVFYTKDERVVGIVLWNIFSRMPLARRVLQEAITTDEIPEIAKLFDVHDKDHADLEA